jgi:hypothetical protein
MVPRKILVISEDWSSDCRRDLPVLARLPAPAQDGPGSAGARTADARLRPHEAVRPGAGSGVAGEAERTRTWPDPRRPSGGGVNRSYAPRPGRRHPRHELRPGRRRAAPRSGPAGHGPPRLRPGHGVPEPILAALVAVGGVRRAPVPPPVRLLEIGAAGQRPGRAWRPRPHLPSTDSVHALMVPALSLPPCCSFLHAPSDSVRRLRLRSISGRSLLTRYVSTSLGTDMPVSMKLV